MEWLCSDGTRRTPTGKPKDYSADFHSFKGKVPDEEWLLPLSQTSIRFVGHLDYGAKGQ
jgi:hypothetical protein